MRAVDQAEVKLMSGHTPMEALAYSVHVSAESVVGYIDDVPACIFGVSGGGLGASVWMLGTDALARRPLSVARASEEPVMGLLARHGVLSNYVHAENKTTLRWLSWLGFEIHPPVPAGLSGAMFCKVIKCVNLPH